MNSPIQERYIYVLFNIGYTFHREQIIVIMATCVLCYYLQSLPTSIIPLCQCAYQHKVTLEGFRITPFGFQHSLRGGLWRQGTAPRKGPSILISKLLSSVLWFSLSCQVNSSQGWGEKELINSSFVCVVLDFLSFTAISCRDRNGLLECWKLYLKPFSPELGSLSFFFSVFFHC